VTIPSGSLVSFAREFACFSSISMEKDIVRERRGKGSWLTNVGRIGFLISYVPSGTQYDDVAFILMPDVVCWCNRIAVQPVMMMESTV
jgi:hypothetical protein